ncbi:hypothetical protein RvY_12899 [Ramazzottius varieornatus]|uniref:Uncharacterized protein n=1 Tax=Ramazzottius varieornatus TaxID=947166 RepID=A0A1D1VTM3_RAMVA|nr:hypothetical protein RvY_12899 [Ramazzottius varieornatus]
MTCGGLAGVVAAGVPKNSVVALIVLICKLTVSMAFIISELLEDAFGQEFFNLGVPYVVYLGIFDPQTLEDGEKVGKHTTWRDVLHFKVPSYHQNSNRRRRELETVSESSPNQLPTGFHSQLWKAYTGEALSRHDHGGAT